MHLNSTWLHFATAAA